MTRLEAMTPEERKAYWRAQRAKYREKYPERIREQARGRDSTRNTAYKQRKNRKNDKNRKLRRQKDAVYAAHYRAMRRRQEKKWNARARLAIQVCQQLGITLEVQHGTSQAT
jgi:hypothetical protein